MGRELGLDRQAGVLPLSERFAEMGGIPVNDDDASRLSPAMRQCWHSLERLRIAPRCPMRSAFLRA